MFEPTSEEIDKAERAINTGTGQPLITDRVDHRRKAARAVLRAVGPMIEQRIVEREKARALDTVGRLTAGLEQRAEEAEQRVAELAAEREALLVANREKGAEIEKLEYRVSRRANDHDRAIKRIDSLKQEKTELDRQWKITVDHFRGGRAEAEQRVAELTAEREALLVANREKGAQISREILQSRCDFATDHKIRDAMNHAYERAAAIARESNDVPTTTGPQDTVAPAPDRETPKGGTTLTVPYSPKSLRETLCRLSTKTSGVDLVRLNRLIDECDRHRPLGPDGKHGDGERCTPTCGCEPASPTGRTQRRNPVMQGFNFVVQADKIRPAFPTPAKIDEMVAKALSVEAKNAFFAGLDAALSGTAVSVDISTGDDDFDKRLFGTVSGVQPGSHGEPVILVEDAREPLKPVPEFADDCLRTRSDVISRDGYRCYWCGYPANAHPDSDA